ncbi:MAG: hypothetical protein WAK13_15965 [Terriglobales bacterium]
MDLFTTRTRPLATWALFGLALAFAFVAGLRTVSDFDVGWLLATGRYLVTHHVVPKTEILSYTAYGTPWIYPPFGGALLYLLYSAGGFAALSWLNAIACALVTALAIGRPRLLSCSLAILAVPSIAFRTVPRAELFTMVFFTAYLALLCNHRRGGRVWLWLLPSIMLVWVNSHSGFAAGIALLGAYVAQELMDLCFSSRRSDAARRLKSAAPWLVLSLLATLINPWGVGVYRALLAHNKLADFQSGVVGEWSAMRLTAASFATAFQLRDPGSGSWWLLVFAGVAAVAALYRRQFVDALLLAGAAYLSLEHVRFQALFAVVVIMISGEVFSRLDFPFRETARRAILTTAATAVAIATIMIASLALLHIADTVSNHWYLADGEFSLFGTGLSWWYPQRASQLIESNALPGQIFNDYNSGGYLTLRLGPRYRDFADGRGIPFPVERLIEQATLQQSSPDSPEWARAADRYGINTIILSIARTAGLEYVPLRQYCSSSQWKPVHLDAVSIVLVRNRPENQPWIERFALDCASYRIAPPSTDSLPVDRLSARQRAELYTFYANTASIYYMLGRDNEAASAVSRAEKLFADDPSMPMLAGQMAQADGNLAEAEAQYRVALQIRSTDMGWFLLARALLAEKKYSEAASALQNSVDLAVSPASRYRFLGNVDLALNRPEEALAAFAKAEHFGEKLAALPGYELSESQVAEGRARAWLALHDASQATAFAQKATRLAPNPQRWSLLAECYSTQGRTEEAEQARSHAKELLAAQ